ncbi:hypothetical protein V7266_17185 [Neobacillus drentensis]
MPNIQEKVVIITGASSGFGEATDVAINERSCTLDRCWTDWHGDS